MFQFSLKRSLLLFVSSLIVSHAPGSYEGATLFRTRRTLPISLVSIDDAEVPGIDPLGVMLLVISPLRKKKSLFLIIGPPRVKPAW
jgi:hypothetical protein